MTRQRCEDLGRLLVMIDEALDSPLFETHYGDDMAEYFLPHAVIENEDNEVYLERFSELERYISSVKNRLFKCLDIAKGEDELNRDEDI